MSIKKQYSTINIEGRFFCYTIEKEGLVITSITVQKKKEEGYEVVMQVPPGIIYRLLEELPEVMREADADYNLNSDNAKETKGGEPQ